MKHLYNLIVFFFVSGFAMSQSVTITGKVVAASDKEPLFGVTVQVLKTDRGTVTDFEGKFTIEAKSGDVLVVTSLGFVTQNVIVGAQTSLEIELAENAQALDQVVIVAYGTESKANLTNSVGQLKNENLDELTYSRVDDALKGKIAGVQISNISGDAGSSPVISIRGLSSITASSRPLIVVDGFPLDNALEFVNPSSIKSIEVLKDASSAALYGSRGANGVILITTKDGDKEPKFTFKSFMGVKSPIRYQDNLNTIEYTDNLLRERQLIENANALNDNRTPIEQSFTSIELGRRIVAQNSSPDGNGTDWLDEALRDNAVIKNYQFDVGGGNRVTKYFFSGQFVDEEGLQIDNEYRALNLQGRFNTKLSEKVKLNVNFRPSFSRTKRSTLSFSDFGRNFNFLPVRHNQFTSDLTGVPVGEYAHARHFNNTSYSVTNPDGSMNNFTVSGLWGSRNNNPIARIENDNRFQYQYRVATDAQVTYDVAKNLQYVGKVGGFFQLQVDERFQNSQANSTLETFGTDLNRIRNRFITEHTLNYKLKLDDHRFDLLAGTTYEYTFLKTSNIDGSGFPTDFIETLNAASVIDAGSTLTLKEEIALVSGLARVNYNYKDKYLLSFAGRVDGSSLFGPENKYGFFPSASAGWNVHKEPFFSKNASAFSQFKVRASYGVVGNNNIQNYSFSNLLFPANYSLGDSNGSLVAGLAENGNTLANRRISWEQTNSSDIGLDFSFLDNKISITTDYYYSITQDLLLNQNVSYATGHDNFINNTGKIQNQGIEFAVSSELNLGPVKWNGSFNISANRNRLISLGGEERFINQGERNEQYIAQVGQEAIQFYGFRTIGIWQSQAEIDANPSSRDDAPGGLRVADINEDGLITAADRTALGSPFPDFIYGFSNTFKYKGFDLYFLIQGSQGGEVLYGDGFYNEQRSLQREFVEGRWIHPDIPATKPFERNGRDWLLTDYLIQDASYVSMREVVIGYSFNEKVTKALHVDNFRIFGTASNLFYIYANNYLGNNPEEIRTASPYDQPLISGYQRGSLPLSRQFAAGIDITF